MKAPRPSRADFAVAAAVGQHAVLGCDIADAVTALVGNTTTRLQASQNRTNPCNTSSPPVTTPITGGGATTTTTTSPTSGPTVTAPTNASVNQLLALAQQQFDAANTALANGDLGLYQADIKRAAAYVQDAIRKNGAPLTTTTLPAAIRSATTTTAPAAGTTTSAP